VTAVIGLLSLTRPRTSVSAGVLGLGIAFHGAMHLDARTWCYPAAVTLSSAFAQVYNDLVDQSADALAKPSRPLPSGAVSRRAAIVLAGVCAAAALAGAAVLSWRCLPLGVVVLLLSMHYSLVVKPRRPLLAPFSVALTVALALALIAVARPDGRSIAPVVAVAAFISGNEIHKSWKDRAGDQRSGTRTLATDGSVRMSSLIVGSSAIVAGTAMFVLLRPFRDGRIMVPGGRPAVEPECRAFPGQQ